MRAPRVVNLCPHEVVVLRRDLDDIVDSVTDVDVLRRMPSAGSCRLVVLDGSSETLTFAGAPVEVRHVRYLAPTDLPEMCDGTFYVVSSVVAAQLQRPDLLVPADQVRDRSGHVLGCRRFQVVDGDRGAE